MGSKGMNTTRIFSVLALSLLTSAALFAQPPGGRGVRGDRGGGEGRPSFGGFRGGGPPGEGGFRGGGPPGGGATRGGDRGGSRGSRGGSRGGFDASSMLSRLDTNGNGVLDPDEQKGPAQFLISRMQQSDPSIQPGKPIPLKKITEGFEKMRAEREGRDSGSTSSAGAADDALIAELLVPGFGVEEEPAPLMGFGATAEMLSVTVTDADKREAAERMRRYDRNRDGFLTKNELSSRFAGNPMDFDRNRDGKLSVSEMAVRYARRREGEEAAKSARSSGQRRGRQANKDQEPADVYNGRKSYRNATARKLPEGLPGFFTDKDANDDGQVTMAEFSSEWNAEVVAEYFSSDLNGDGIITAAEAIHAVEQGSSGSSAMASASSSGSSADGGGGESASAGGGSPSGKPDDKLVSYAKRIISRYDKNKDDALTASEWKPMLMSPAAADANRDGRVTIIEYALWMESRSKKK